MLIQQVSPPTEGRRTARKAVKIGGLGSQVTSACQTAVLCRVGARFPAVTNCGAPAFA